jgi:molybdate transport system ATP-binding protein/molybdate transport system permease protein
MVLDVQLEKKLPQFELNVAFSATEAPLSILGPSGAGKTMLLRCIAGLERADRGRICLGERVLFDSERGIRVPARQRRVGMVFQNYALFPHCTVAENIGFGVRELSNEKWAGRVTELIERTHLKELANRYPRALSGGEQQRTALARALAIDPQALLLDEPLSALDTHLRSQVEMQIQEVFSVYRRPALLVTHNIEEAYRLGERLLVLSRGRMAAYGAKEDVFRNPPTREVAQVTGCKNFSHAKMNSDGSVEAFDWRCRLRVEQTMSKPPAYVGIRAHYIDFLESAPANTGGENIFPCWLVRASETPFRITLYLRLHDPNGDETTYDLQAEVFKEKWQRFRNAPCPWHVQLPPESLFLTPE